MRREPVNQSNKRLNFARNQHRLLDDIMLLSIRSQFDRKEEFERQGFSVHILGEYNPIIEIELKSSEDNDYY